MCWRYVERKKSCKFRNGRMDIRTGTAAIDSPASHRLATVLHRTTILTPHATSLSTHSSNSFSPATPMYLPSHATATPLNLSRLSDWSRRFYYAQITVSEWMSDLRRAAHRAVRHSTIVSKRHRSLQQRSVRKDDTHTCSVIDGFGPRRLPPR